MIRLLRSNLRKKRAEWIEFLGLIRMSIFRSFQNYELHGNVKFLVVSPGGVATTMLIEQISRYHLCNDSADRDGLKHRPIPPRHSHGNNQPKVLFVSGRPGDIVRSLEKRGYLRAQAAKLGVPLGPLLPTLILRRCVHYAVIRQRRNWSKYSGEVLRIEYDDLWSNQKQMATFLEIDADSYVRNFPEFRNRASGLG